MICSDWLHHVPFFSVHFQSFDDDCTLEEEEEGLVEEEDEIDQFNDDTFGAGAIGKSAAFTRLVGDEHEVEMENECLSRSIHK